jgi:hypothetical protein
LLVIVAAEEAVIVVLSNRIAKFRKTKGDKMDFKVGDWVRWSGFGLEECFQVHAIDEDSQVLQNSDGLVYHVTQCEPWKPKEGEYCWFWNDNQLLNNGSPHFGQYGVLSYTEEFYEHCEPFVGNMPTFAKNT